MSRELEILADDTDSRIQYFGNWNLTTAQELLDAGVNAPGGTKFFAFNDTLHGNSGDNQGFTFQFNGASRIVFLAYFKLKSFRFPCTGTSSVVVYGSIPNYARFNATCVLDGRSTSFTWTGNPQLPARSFLNNVLICEVENVGGSSTTEVHQLAFSIFDTFFDTTETPISFDTFYLDYIAYQALPADRVDGEIVRRGEPWRFPSLQAQGDPLIAKSTGWDSGIMQTSIPGSTITVDFNGLYIHIHSAL
jgi:hypothetical protein